MSMPWILLYDEDEADIYRSFLQLRDHQIATDAISMHGSRLELFEVIARSEVPIIALVDLQADERNDQNYSGHRIIETICRHPTLEARCRPLAFTVHARPDIVRLALSHGAHAVVSKTDLDVPDDQVPVVGFEHFLHQVLNDHEKDGQRRVFPSTDQVRERQARDEARATLALERLLVCSSNGIIAKPFFWDMVRYLASGLEPASTAHWVEADNPVVSARTVIKTLEDLKPLVAYEYRTGSNVEWKQFASDLLELLPQYRPAPSLSDALRVLPRISELGNLLVDKELQQKGYLDTAASEALNLVLDREALPRRRGHEGRWKHIEELQGTLREIEPNNAHRAALTAAFTRGVYNVYATYLELRTQARERPF
jgi:CheY-like chemotaxis protein